MRAQRSSPAKFGDEPPYLNSAILGFHVTPNRGLKTPSTIQRGSKYTRKGGKSTGSMKENRRTVSRKKYKLEDFDFEEDVFSSLQRAHLNRKKRSSSHKKLRGSSSKKKWKSPYVPKRPKDANSRSKSKPKFAKNIGISSPKKKRKRKSSPKKTIPRSQSSKKNRQPSPYILQELNTSERESLRAPREAPAQANNEFSQDFEITELDYENYVFDSLEELLIEMIGSVMDIKNSQGKNKKNSKNFVNNFLAVNLGTACIDGPNMKGLILSIIIGKIRRVFDSIKDNNADLFLEQLGIAELRNYEELDQFDMLVKQYSALKKKFLNKDFKNKDKNIRVLCTNMLSIDIIASELVRLISTCSLNLNHHQYS